MKKTKFDAETFFESKIKGGDLRSHGSVLNFTTPLITFTKKPREKGIKRICKELIEYDRFKILNKLHTEYMTELKNKNKGNAFNNILYGAELSGAEIEIDNKKGFVVEERKNSISVVFPDNKVKLYPKDVWNFLYLFDNCKYYFVAKKLKKNRFFK